MIETGLSLDYLHSLDETTLATIEDIYLEREKEMSRGR